MKTKTYPTDSTEAFELFWEMRKRGSRINVMALFKEAAAQHGTQLIVEKYSQYLAMCARENTSDRYIKLPENWLKEKLWENDYAPPQSVYAYIGQWLKGLKIWSMLHQY